MNKKFTNPSNLRSMFEALRIESGHKRYCLSDQERQRGAELLAEWRQSSPLDDRRLGAATLLASIEGNQDDLPAVRLAAASAPPSIQSLVFLHGVVTSIASDEEEEGLNPVGQLF